MIGLSGEIPLVSHSDVMSPFLPSGNGGYASNRDVSFHCYADDTQLYISSRPGETHQIEKLIECIVDIKSG